MKKFLLIAALFSALGVNAQSRGIKIAYIDMEYILEKVPDYAEAKNQLELKAQKWKQEIEVKKTDINKLKESLKTEKVLLTKELIQEREEEIAFLEKELLDYQEKRFGPKGDLITQKSVLVKPIQDQVFTAVQDISEQRKLDFVFDKSSDLTMLYSARKHDISDVIVNRLKRSAGREQLSRKEIKRLEETEAKEELESDPEYVDKMKVVEDRKEARKKLIEDRKAAKAARVKEAQEKREKQKQDREAQRTGKKPASDAPATAPGNQGDLDGDDAPAATNTNRPATNAANAKTNTKEPVQGENSMEVKTTATDTPEEGKQETVDRQTRAQEQRDKNAAARKAALEARKKRIQDREAAKKAKEEQKDKKDTPPTEGAGEGENKE